METIEYLTSLKEKINTAKEKKARIEGNQEVLYKRLKELYGVDTLEEAEELLEKKKKQLSVKQGRLERSVNALKERMDDILE